MKLFPLAVLLVLQYICLSITVTVYPAVYFPGIRIAGLAASLLLDVAGYILWRSLIRPQFSVLRDLPQPPVRLAIPHPDNLLIRLDPRRTPYRSRWSSFQHTSRSSSGRMGQQHPEPWHDLVQRHAGCRVPCGSWS